MGNVGGRATSSPAAIERSLPWGVILRGFRWGHGPDVTLLLHEPGADVDAWGPLPVQIARQLEIETVAIDLPGHGLSDDPWESMQLPDLLRNLPEIAPAAGRRFLVAAGNSAIAALELAPAIDVSGLVCLSPQMSQGGGQLTRSPGVPKLLVAGSMAGSDLHDARRLAAACGGWAVVTSYPVAERGTGLLASPWGTNLLAEIVTFLGDCRRRPAHAGLPTDRSSTGSPSAPSGRPPLPSSTEKGYVGEGVPNGLEDECSRRVKCPPDG